MRHCVWRLTTTSVLQDLGFIFLYELLTGTINIKVGFDDDSFNWGSIFIRMLAPEDTQVRYMNGKNYIRSRCREKRKHVKKRKLKHEYAVA